ncbi:hypothetical protein N7463_007662 [Penicillium fimorum]|uniref:Uncharacterized protein n=1 Tax=Penicillium fimorum TaxID=1882269 RepID=A0A9W9XWV0_9EURO|nr:hypothetical protein N7463_007662 [Penicillium fimorum]
MENGKWAANTALGGPWSRRVYRLAEEVVLSWKSDLSIHESDEIPGLLFAFSSGVLSGFSMTQDLATADISITEETAAIHENFLNRRGWIQKDLYNLNILAYLKRGHILVLQIIENCDHTSREAL